MKALLKRGISEHRRSLDLREYSSQELTRAYLDEIYAQDKTLNAFLYVDEVGAMAQSKESDCRMLRGEGRGVLEGIPYSLQDHISAKGLPMSCASRMLEGYVSPYDATITERLRSAGAVLLGKNNMEEMAVMGAGTLSAHGAANAAAVAAGLTSFSLGTGRFCSFTDACNIATFVPSSGVLSRHGVALLASSADRIGILSHSSADCRTVLEILEGKDERDATSVSLPHLEECCGKKMPRVLIPYWVGEEGTSAAAHAAQEVARRRFTRAGAQCFSESVALPSELVAAYTVLFAAEAASGLSRYDGVRFGKRGGEESLASLYSESRAMLGDEVLARLLFGIDMLSGEHRERYYLRALSVREEVRALMRSLTDRYDLILLPGALEQTSREDALCTALTSLCGVPVVSLPMETDEKGTVASVRLCAGEGRDAALLCHAQCLAAEDV